LELHVPGWGTSLAWGPPPERPNKALELTGRRWVGLPGLPAGGRPVRGELGGRPPDGAWYLHGRPAAQCLVRWAAPVRLLFTTLFSLLTICCIASATSIAPIAPEELAQRSVFFGLVRVLSAELIAQPNDPNRNCGVRYRAQPVHAFRASTVAREFWLASPFPLSPDHEYLIALRPTEKIKFGETFLKTCAAVLPYLAVESSFPVDSLSEREWPHRPERLERCGPPPYLHDKFSQLAVPPRVSTCLIVPDCGAVDECLPWLSGLQLISWPELRAHLDSTLRSAE
jgi:hypothetical protein